MKKILTLVLVSALGGVLTLGAYKLFLEPEQNLVVASNQTTPTYLPTSNVSTLYNVEEKANFVTAAENTVNAVVHVKNVAASSGQMSIQDLFLGRTPSPQYRMGSGSGVIIDPSGYIITNNHVIKNSQQLSVTLNNNKTYEAEIIGTDPETDIAILKIKADEDLPVVNFGNSDDASIGEWVLAVGNPYNLTSTVTAGIISAKGRDLHGNGVVTDSFLQTDAAVNPGNSGGALVNTRGELVGINTAITSKTGSFIGYSFAVPSNIAKKIVDDLLEYGTVQEAVIGFYPFDDKKGEIQGVKISRMDEDSQALKAGLQVGDIIKKVNNVNITKFSDLSGQLTAKRPGELVNITVDRDGDLLTKAVKLSKKVKRFISKSFNWELKNLSKKELKRNSIKNGVKIFQTGEKDAKNSLKNFIITKINDKEVDDAEEAVKLLEGFANSRYSIVIEMINTDGEKERLRFR